MSDDWLQKFFYCLYCGIGRESQYSSFVTVSHMTPPRGDSLLQQFKYYRKNDPEDRTDENPNIEFFHIKRLPRVPDHCPDAMVCLGITRTYEIGLDIVKTNSCIPFPEIENYLFILGERRSIEQTILEQRSLQFFRIWSLKEALLKATGNDATMMKEADVSGIITERFLNGFYIIQLGKKDFWFFIHESDCWEGHHCVITSCRNEKINMEI